MKTLPAEFRYRVIALTDEGMTTSEITEVLGVSGAWARSVNALHKTGQPLEPKSRVNNRRSLARREGPRIRDRVHANPSATLEDLERDLGLNTSVSNLWIAVRELKIRLKKKRSTPPNKTAPTSSPTTPSGTSSPPASTRDASFPRRNVRHHRHDPTRRLGPMGQRVHDAAPYGHWKTTTFVAAFRLAGLFAPVVVDGALTGEVFAADVRQHLAPQLRPGDILVMDNLATHGVHAAVDAVRAVDARVLYLPPDRPALNPIEQVFSKIKTELRRRELRTSTELEHAFGQSLDGITPTDARHDFQHAGYTLGRN